MADELITVFGGSGFIGRRVVKALTRQGKRVRVALRRPHLGFEMRLMGDVGQVQLVQANVRNAESVARALEGAIGAVNLVGLLYEKGAQSFRAVHVEGAASIAKAAAAEGIQRLVHISAIGASPGAKARYARSKGEAEQAVRAALPSATILRPSIVFGAEDEFYNRFAAMAQTSPVLPLIGFGKTKLQPIYVADLAEAVVAGLDRADARGRTFELGGPQIVTMKETLEYILRVIDRRRPLAPLPFFVAQPLGMMLEAVFRLSPFHAPPLTGDQVEMLKSDNIVGISGEAGIGTIAELGVEPLETIEAIVPSYLWKYRPYGQFQTTQTAV